MKRQDELNEAWCKYMGKCSTEIMQALAFALRWCDQHPNWISVKDKKPELKHSEDNMKYSDTVIVTNGKYSTSARWVHNTWAGWYGWYDDGDEELKDVTHWMPRPAPPEHIADVSKKISSSEIPNNQKGGEQ